MHTKSLLKRSLVLKACVSTIKLIMILLRNKFIALFAIIHFTKKSQNIKALLSSSVVVNESLLF